MTDAKFKVGDRIRFSGGRHYLDKGNITAITAYPYYNRYSVRLDNGDTIDYSNSDEMELMTDKSETSGEVEGSKETRVGYYQLNGGIQAWDMLRHLDFNCGNAGKYILRHGKKIEEGTDARKMAVKDLNKAMDYIFDEIVNVLGGECRYKLK